VSSLLLDTGTALATREPGARGSAMLGGPTLDDVIAGAWACLTEGNSAGCPGCGEELRPAGPAGITLGLCVTCGAELS
jgi:hypothetical protein